MEYQQQEHEPCSNEVDAGLYDSTSLVSGNVNGGDAHELEVYSDASFNYPPGYRFMPYDHELLLYYLKPKVFDMYLPPNVIQEAELYKFTPDQLSASFKPNEEKIWYFFTQRDRKHKNGIRPNRAVGKGYWRASGADKKVEYHNVTVGFKKQLVFRWGKGRKGDKTDWIMHEYRLKDPPQKGGAADGDMRLQWVLCRIYNKADKSSRGRSNTRAREDSVDEIKAQHEDTRAHVSAEPNVLIEETAIPPHSGNINGCCNLQATGLPPLNSCGSATGRISDDMRYIESRQNMLRDNEIWAENENNGHVLAQVSNVLHQETVIPPNNYGNCSRQATRMQYFNTYDNVASWQKRHGIRYIQKRQSLPAVRQSRFHPYMHTSTPMHHMTHVYPNTRYQNPGFEEYACQNSVYQNLLAAKDMPGSSASASNLQKIM